MRNLCALFLSLLALPALTQAAQDPPGRVARLSHVEGEVSMAPAGTQEWGEAVLNRPLTSEDRLFVDQGARAELQIGTASIHLDSSTEFSFIDLDDDAMTMKLTEGRVTIRILRKREREEIEINTPNASVALLHPGEYHIEVGEDGDTTVVKTRSGEAEVAGEGKSYAVRADEVGVFRGTEELSADVSKLGPRTAFEDWANERSSRNERSASSRYVGEGVIGYEDLDDNGEWVREPEYGYVWRPTYVVAGWAPYRHGRWAWVSPWGWTWIDDARWGFAPFHYGRWAYASNRWCWVPGPRHIHAVYAPALVAWTGGPHVSFGVSIGSGIGWFPLGPREVYVPGYWHTHRYIHRVNVSNTVIVNNTYINNAYRGRYQPDYRYRGRPDAVTIVDREHFVRGQPVGSRHARVDEQQLRGFRHDARPPAIAPERDSLRAAQPRTPRSYDVNRGARQVVARRELPNRVGFDAERQAIDANGGRPVARTALIDRNPKDRSDVRVTRLAEARDRQGDASRSPSGSMVTSSERLSTRQRLGLESREAVQRDRSGERRVESRSGDLQDGQAQNPGSAVESMPATEVNSDRGRISRPQREWSQDRSAAGSAATIDSNRQHSSSGSSSPRSSNWAEQRAQRQEQLDQSHAVDARRRESQQRIQRDPVQREAPRIEQRRTEPRYSVPQSQSQSQSQVQPQPQSQRAAPSPRSMSSPSGPKEGRSSNHMRGGERGHSSRER
jgi:hypothetical protein